MKKIATLLATLAVGITLAAQIAHADQTTPLGDKMKVIAGSVKKLKNQVADSTQQQSSLQLVQAAEDAAKAAKQLVPAKAATLPEADRAKFITDFQTQMDVLIKQFDTISADLTAGKYDDAQKDFAKLNDIKRDGHKAFIKQQD